MCIGLVMYEVIGDKQLLNVGQSTYDYNSKMASFQKLDLSAVPYELPARANAVNSPCC